VSDARVTLRDKMLSGKFADSVVIYAYKVAGKPLKESIDKNEWNASLAYLAQILSALLARSHNKAIRAMRQHVLDFVLLKLRITL
jgi:DNA-binding GntR family transcriptional regulator